jgi:hypothetical protein
MEKNTSELSYLRRKAKERDVAERMAEKILSQPDSKAALADLLVSFDEFHGASQDYIFKLEEMLASLQSKLGTEAFNLQHTERSQKKALDQISKSKSLLENETYKFLLLFSRFRVTGTQTQTPTTGKAD